MGKKEPYGTLKNTMVLPYLMVSGRLDNGNFSVKSTAFTSDCNPNHHGELSNHTGTSSIFGYFNVLHFGPFVVSCPELRARVQSSSWTLTGSVNR